MKALFSLIAAAWSTQAMACAPSQDAQDMIGEGETSLSAALALDPRALSQPFDMELWLCGDLDRIERVKVAAIMPAHQHGMNYEPTVHDRGNGTFSIKSMVFHMPGTWRVQVVVYGPEAPEFFNLEVEAR